MYRTYGNSYFNDVYYPDRVAAQNERGTVLVLRRRATARLPVIMLERNQAGPVAEGGQAVVDAIGVAACWIA